MIRAAILAIACLAVFGLARAHADPIDDHVAAGRALFDKGDYLHARDELLAAYQIDARPELLFALGQCELNLEHYAVAIDYYEKYLATQPGDDQAALAQQAIGAARARIAEAKRKSEQPPPPPPPVMRRRWDTLDTELAAIGAGGIGLGVGLVLYGRKLGNDRSGKLSDYDSRYARAQVTQYAGIGCVAAGLATIGFAMYRWRYHLVAEVQPGSAALSMVTRW